MSVTAIQQRIKELEDELKKTQYNKATEHHFGVVKAQIAKLREKAEKRESAKSGAGAGFSLKKSGDATAVIVGFPSVGKSSLLNSITNAQSRVASYDFTTLTVIPGELEYNNAHIQILDVPGILQGAARGKGRGKEVLAMVRNADLIIILVDALHPEHYAAILRELADAGIRINQRLPEVRITKKARGGISIGTTLKLTKISRETIIAVLKELRVSNADVLIRADIDIDQLIDVVEGNKHYLPAITVVSKIDLLDDNELKKIEGELKPDVVVSAEKGINLELLKEAIFQGLNLVRIFLKQIGKKPDLDEPMIVRKGATVRDVCLKIHKDFVRRFRYVKIWGKSAKFPGQQFRLLDKHIEDGDIIEVHLS